MIVIGELINGMYKDVRKAIANKEADVIQHLAADQVKAGARVLDVNTGPYSKNPKEDMKWLIDSIQKATDVSLSIDSTKFDVIEEGLKLAKNKAIINSTNADDEKMSKIFELAKKYNAQVIGLTMDKSGVPNSKEKRLELAATIVAKAMDYGINADDIFLDPIVLPVNVAQSQGIEELESIRQFRHLSDPDYNVFTRGQSTKTTADYFFSKWRKRRRQNIMIENARARDWFAGDDYINLSTEELATLWHFPKTADLNANVATARAGVGVPPSEYRIREGYRKERLIEGGKGDVPNNLPVPEFEPYNYP